MLVHSRDHRSDWDHQKCFPLSHLQMIKFEFLKYLDCSRMEEDWNFECPCSPDRVNEHLRRTLQYHKNDCLEWILTC